MRFYRPPLAESPRIPELRYRCWHGAQRPAACLAFVITSVLWSGALLAAQSSQAPASGTPTAHKHATHTSKKPSPAQPAPQPAPAPAPDQPKPPDWPANDLPAQASVVFDSHGLLIVASNSSLTQILKEVSTDTGVKVEGLSQDQRVFGTFGPGPARDVLNQLLDGSGYNILMVGDRGQGTPRRIVLSMRSGSGAQHPANSGAPAPDNGDTDADQPPPEPQADQEPPAPAAAPPVPMRTPQQIIQEMQERQRQMQQTQNGQQNPQN